MGQRSRHACEGKDMGGRGCKTILGMSMQEECFVWKDRKESGELPSSSRKGLVQASKQAT